MSTLTFQTTGNEARLLTTVFPKNYDITTMSYKDAADMPRFKDYGYGVNRIVHSAIEFSCNKVVDPTKFSRKLVPGDKGTPDSANWPMPETRKCIKLSTDEEEIFSDICLEFFEGDRTKTIIWMLYNFNRLVSMNMEILGKRKGPSKAKNEDDTKVMSLRLPVDVTEYAEAQAISEGITAGRWIRETITTIIREMMPNEPEPTVDDSDDFDYDLEG